MTSVRAHYIPPRRRTLSGAHVDAKDFLVPATVGTMAGVIAGIATRMALDGEHDATKDSAAYLVNSGVFLIVGGLMFVWRQAHKRR